MDGMSVLQRSGQCPYYLKQIIAIASHYPTYYINISDRAEAPFGLDWTEPYIKCPGITLEMKITIINWIIKKKHIKFKECIKNMEMLKIIAKRENCSG